MNRKDIPLKTDENGHWLTARDMNLSCREAREMMKIAGVKLPRKRRWKVKRAQRVS